VPVDRWIWKINKIQEFSVNSVYGILRECLIGFGRLRPGYGLEGSGKYNCY